MRLYWLCLVACLASACTGNVQGKNVSEGNDELEGGGGHMGGKDSTGGFSTGGGGTTASPLLATSGPMPLRRLSRQEYANTLRDLLGQAPKSDELFSVDESGPYGYAQGGSVSSQEVERMLEATSTIIGRFAADQMKTTAPCQPKDDTDRACTERIVKWFSGRAFRRTVIDSEVVELMKSFDAARMTLSLADSLKETLQLVLLSPRFHYHWERGDASAVLKNGLVVLNDFEVASRLSYFLWQTMPDNELLGLAQAGTLANPATVAAQVKRMLADAKASQGIRGFVSQWLPLKGLRADDSTLADHAIRASMQESLLKFVDDLIIGQGDRRFSTLVSADYAFVDGEVAKLLGMKNVAANAPMQRMILSDPTRSGLFTQPAFLAATSDTPLATIIHRGRYVFERLGSCSAVPPPSGAIPPPPDKPANASVREHLQEHSNNGVCKACHQMMDPMGFAFDRFDSMGRVRANDDYGKPAVTDGVMPLTDSVSLNFADAADLLKQLGKQEPSMRCFARQLFSYGLRLPNDEANEDSIVKTENAFVADGGNIALLMSKLAQTDSFFLRQPAKGEVLQ